VQPEEEKDNTVLYVTLVTIAIVGGLLLIKKNKS